MLLQVWLPWVFAIILIILLACLLGQAAYIRSRLDSIPLPTSTTEDQRCLACNPAVRAYSLRIKTTATNALRLAGSTATQRVQVTRQLGSCAGQTAQIENGTFAAKWLVVHGPKSSVGGAMLQYDVFSGYTKYLIVAENTYIVVATTGSAAYLAARNRPEVGEDDLLFLVATLAQFGATFKGTAKRPDAAVKARTNDVRFQSQGPGQSSSPVLEQDVPCFPIMTRAPINTPTDEPDDSIAFLLGCSGDDIALHAWGYSSGASNVKDAADMFPVDI